MSNQNNINQADKAIMDIGITRIDTSKVVRPFGEVLEEIAPQGIKVKLEDINGREVIIHAARPFSGDYGPALFVVMADAETGELMNTIVGQTVVLPKLAAVIKALPVLAKFVIKEGGQNEFYWDIE